MPHVIRLLVLALIVGCQPLFAATTFPGWFSDHQVLQRDQAVPIWGLDEPGTQVTVTFGEQTKTATADADGKWLVNLDPMPAQATGAPLTAVGSSTVTLQDVVVGEVWLCSGQSNMAMSVASCVRGDKSPANPVNQAIAAADLPLIRMVTIRRSAKPAGPETNASGTWVPCSSSSVRGFSAVAFFMGRQLHAELGVPIGLIHSSWGGTPVEAWTPMAALDQTPAAATYLEDWRGKAESWDAEKAAAAYKKQLADWEVKAAEAKTAGEKAPRKPRAAQSPIVSPHYPATLYNGMIHPLLPYGIRGAIWYQGESNAGRANTYGTLFPLMITSWRERFKQGNFPFGYVQLVAFQQPVKQPSDSNWASLREAQDQALALPNVGRAVGIDAGEAGDIHPRYKIDIGDRLAYWALATVYGQADRVYSGPRYRDMAVKDGTIVLQFHHIGSGLITAAKDGHAPPVATPEAPLAMFQIAGEDKRWVWADAAIVGDTVVVSSPDVPAPVAVRYAWATNPAGANLYNAALLPASPFRTDSW